MDKRIFFLMGNWFERQEALNKIKESLDIPDFSMYDKSFSYEYVQQQIMNFSCFGEKKLIIIKELPSIKAPDKSQARIKVLGKFKKLLINIPDDCYVVFNGITISNQSFIKAVEDISIFNIFPQSLDKEHAKKYVYNFFKNKTIEDNDVSFLINAVSPNDKKIDLDKLFIIMHKINHYVGARKVITNNDIFVICSDSNDFIIWSLFKGLDEKDFHQCSVLIDKMISFSHNIEGDIVAIIFTLIGRYRLLLFVKDCLIKKIKKEDIWKKLSNFKKMNYVGMGYKRKVKLITEEDEKNKKIKKEKDMYSFGYFNGLFFSYGRKQAPIYSYTKEELITINSILQKTLIKIRSGCSESEIINILELLCIVICNMLKKNSIVDIFKSSCYR